MPSLTSLALLSLLLTSLCYPAVGQTASCTTSLLGLTSCLGVAAPAPGSACCTSAISANDNSCLCDPSTLEAAAQFGATAAAVRDIIASCEIPVDDVALPGTTNCPAVAGVPSAAPADLLATLLAPAPAPLSDLANITAPAPAPLSDLDNVTAPAPAPLSALVNDTAPAPAPLSGLANDTAPAPAPLSALVDVTAPAPAPVPVNETDVDVVAPASAVANAPTVAPAATVAIATPVATPAVAASTTTGAPNAAPGPPSAAGSTVVQKLTVVLGLCAVAAAL